jgi:methylenetetrahydrofolate dehydrogenase (NADP+)/methenyltetrahydrofolate cyclohydrolase
MSAANIIAGTAQADAILDLLSSSIERLHLKHGIVPGLAIVLVGHDAASEIYVSRKLSKAKEVGINAVLLRFEESVHEHELKDAIHNLNSDASVHGILLQLPLTASYSTYAIINAIDPRKDVDGFTVHNVGLLHTQQPGLLPATPQGCILLIKSCLGNNLSGSKAVVLGRSQIVGRPMATMLLNEHCTVTLVHSMSVYIMGETREADIIVSAMGRPEMLTAEFIKPGACVIDVGITRTPEGIKGDVHFPSVAKVAGFLTPVPGGVGPMTVACMLANTVKACCMQHNIIEVMGLDETVI